MFKETCRNFITPSYFDTLMLILMRVLLQLLFKMIRPISLSAKDLLNEPELTNVAILDQHHHSGILAKLKILTLMGVA